MRLELGLADVEPCAQILPDRPLALRLRRPAERGQVIGLDPRKIILGLGIDHPEHRVGVGPAMDMGNPEIVAGDGDRLRLFAPSRLVGGSGGDEEEGEREEQRTHSTLYPGEGRGPVRC